MKKLLFLLLLAAPCKADIYDKVLDQSVLIHIVMTTQPEMFGIKLGKPRRGMAGCSGTFISEDTVLTAAHCFDFDEVHGIYVKDFAGVTNKADVVMLEKAKDLAVIKVHRIKHHFAKLGTTPKRGQVIINVGSPFGMPFLLSTGIVSQLGFSIDDFTAIYTITTAMINPGSSGGGVFDLHGRLIGVNTMSIGGSEGWAGISAAVDINTVRKFLG